MSGVTFLDGRVTLHKGDCLAVLATLPEASVDAIVSDPPYGIDFMGKGWDAAENAAFNPALWREVLRVLKPGGHLVAFSGTRTYHRLACAIEDAGFEVRDQLAWTYATGFPKSLDVSKAIDKARRRDYVQAALDMGVGPPGRSVDDWTKEGHAPGDKWWGEFKAALPAETWAAIERRVIGAAVSGSSAWFASGVGDITAPATDAAREWSGWGTALKPAWEPICLARRPLIGTVAANVLAHGTGALNIDGCRIDSGGTHSSANSAGQGAGRGTANHDGTAYGKGLGGVIAEPHPSGRWPANILHDGSDEVLACFPDSAGQLRPVTGQERSHRTANAYGDFGATRDGFDPRGDSGSAARFFFSSKADSDDRLGSKHPTVKPVDLMQWLVRLVCPKGGIVLDPFAGTGTTGEAAWREGMRAVLIEREPEYQADIARRMGLAAAGPEERRRAVVKAKGLVEDAGPLFGGLMEAGE